LNSEWTLAHLEERVTSFSLDQARSLPRTIATLDKANLNLNDRYITMPIPLNWDDLLANESKNNYELANKWRVISRSVIQNYYARGYTTITQVKDEEHETNLQIMALNFNPFEPPSELLIA
jgi:predicted GNAT superfamily acetyltransferase